MVEIVSIIEFIRINGPWGLLVAILVGLYYGKPIMLRREHEYIVAEKDKEIAATRTALEQWKLATLNSTEALKAYAERELRNDRHA
jgi:hypothetical protein